MGKLNFILCLVLFGVVFAEAIDDRHPSLTFTGQEPPITDAKELRDLENKISARLTEFGPVRINSAKSKIVTGRSYELIAEVHKNGQPLNCTINFSEEPLQQDLRLKCIGKKTTTTTTTSKDCCNKRKKRSIRNW